MTVLDLPCAPYDYLELEDEDDVERVAQFNGYLRDLERAEVAVLRDLVELQQFVSSIPGVRWG